MDFRDEQVLLSLQQHEAVIGKTAFDHESNFLQAQLLLQNLKAVNKHRKLLLRSNVPEDRVLDEIPQDTIKEVARLCACFRARWQRAAQEEQKTSTGEIKAELLHDEKAEVKMNKKNNKSKLQEQRDVAVVGSKQGRKQKTKTMLSRSSATSKMNEQPDFFEEFANFSSDSYKWLRHKKKNNDDHFSLVLHDGHAFDAVSTLPESKSDEAMSVLLSNHPTVTPQTNKRRKGNAFKPSARSNLQYK